MTTSRIRERLQQPMVTALERSTQRRLIEQDLDQWWETRLRFLDDHDVPRDDHAAALRYCLAHYREFRNVLYYRLQRGDAADRGLAKLARRVWRPVDGLDISCPAIGPGLVVRHGYGTILSAERIGRNCFVHRGVTIGWDERGDRSPRVGDDVYIGAGAKVLGPITVGDGVRIGANAVVLSDVPDGSTAVGVPARVVGHTQDSAEMIASAISSVATDGRSSPSHRRS
jgi:serine O-acetyltransferase